MLGTPSPIPCWGFHPQTPSSLRAGFKAFRLVLRAAQHDGVQGQCPCLGYGDRVPIRSPKEVLRFIPSSLIMRMSHAIREDDRASRCVRRRSRCVKCSCMGIAWDEEGLLFPSRYLFGPDCLFTLDMILSSLRIFPPALGLIGRGVFYVFRIFFDPFPV